MNCSLTIRFQRHRRTVLDPTHLLLGQSTNPLLVRSRRDTLYPWMLSHHELHNFLWPSSHDEIHTNRWSNYWFVLYQRYVLLPRTRSNNWALGRLVPSVAILRSSFWQFYYRRNRLMEKRLLVGLRRLRVRSPPHCPVRGRELVSTGYSQVEQPSRGSRLLRLVGVWQIRVHKGYFFTVLTSCHRLAAVFIKPVIAPTMIY
jgi:hypothetical protein